VVKIKWLTLAERDLKEVERYISKDSPTQAVSVVLRIIEAVEVLVNHPGIGRQGRVEDTRELVLSDLPYIIPYRQKNNWIEILRVFHQARKWPEQF
jgi:toxin ParE1/3/4